MHNTFCPGVGKRFLTETLKTQKLKPKMTNRLYQNCVVCSWSWSIAKIKRCTTEYEDTI